MMMMMLPIGLTVFFGKAAIEVKDGNITVL
jgi:hypothetical protein